ncbi:hypothetical protein [Segetibacter koreensis]|uniref:hypothetical protein n=1 Tax=Segetibacter koreensis TaxID=398037 RepID=UPI0003707463|nr:hypothetical protein [Segetibacter koreensis]
MNNPQFTVLYNGHPVAVTKLDNDTYIVQATYKPQQIQLKKNSDGSEKWVEVETQLQTFLTNEMGRLITDHLHSVKQPSEY